MHSMLAINPNGPDTAAGTKVKGAVISAYIPRWSRSHLSVALVPLTFHIHFIVMLVSYLTLSPLPLSKGKQST